MKPHKHSELIKLWADGAEIDYRLNCSHAWSTTDNPNWEYVGEFRIKPEPKPDVVFYGVAINKTGSAEVYSLGQMNARTDNNIRLTFDGETGKLKAAEVLK